MKEVLDPLMRIPGVRVAALSTPDGVPIAWRGELEHAEDSGSEALSGLVAGWVNALGPSLGLVSWDLPQCVQIKCSRGTLVVRRAPSAILLVVLEPGTMANEVRLPLEAALNRLQRVARGARAPAPALPGRIDKGPAAALVDNATDPSTR